MLSCHFIEAVEILFLFCPKKLYGYDKHCNTNNVGQSENCKLQFCFFFLNCVILLVNQRHSMCVYSVPLLLLNMMPTENLNFIYIKNIKIVYFYYKGTNVMHKRDPLYADKQVLFGLYRLTFQ